MQMDSKLDHISMDTFSDAIEAHISDETFADKTKVLPFSGLLPFIVEGRGGSLC